VLPKDVHAEIDVNSWRPGPVFDWLAVSGHIASDEMRRTFNCGVGMAVIVAADDAAATVLQLQSDGQTAWRMGGIVPGSGGVRYI
jgi:phosphoribosylformylglycinamidine cyclo-ligase